MSAGSAFWSTLGASLLAALVTTLGIWTIHRHAAWGQRNSVYFMCFAAGVLVAAPMLHMIPRAIELNAQAPVWLLSGFFLMHLFNRFFTAMVCERDPARVDYALGVLPMIGIGFHSLLDGVIYSVTFSDSLLTGTIASIGMVLHEFPEGIVTFLLLLQAGVAVRRALWLAFIAAAATTPLGMLLSWPMISQLAGAPLGALLALSAGALVYVGATHLLPRAEQAHRRYSLVALAGGVAVAFIVVASKS